MIQYEKQRLSYKVVLIMAHSAEKVLLELYDLLSTGLEEIDEAYRNAPIPDFARGMKNAYIECLETVQKWEHAKENGLDWVIEDMFPPE